MKFQYISFLSILSIGARSYAFAPKSTYWHKNQPLIIRRSQISSLDDVGTTEVEKSFSNDGPFSWMSPYLGVFGYEEGKSSVYAIPVPVSLESSKDTPTAEEIADRQKEAREKMFNIGPEERERRGEAAKIFRAVTIAYAIYASLVIDQGDVIGHLARFAIILPLFFTIGFQRSAEEGL